MLKVEHLNRQHEDHHTNQVEDALDRVLKSRSFRRARRLKDLLSYIVRAAVEGKSTDERRTARELFARGADFSPTLDPIIRVHFGRLRRTLATYYIAEGHQDPLVIEIPSRSYTPTFHFRGPKAKLDDSPCLLVDAFRSSVTA